MFFSKLDLSLASPQISTKFLLSFEHRKFRKKNRESLPKAKVVVVLVVLEVGVVLVVALISIVAVSSVSATQGSTIRRLTTG